MKTLIKRIGEDEPYFDSFIGWRYFKDRNRRIYFSFSITIGKILLRIRLLPFFQSSSNTEYIGNIYKIYKDRIVIWVK